MRSALAFVPAVERDDWLKVGMALHEAGWERGFAIWCDWSRSAPGKYNEADQERTWNSFDRLTANKRHVTVASVYQKAAANGWSDAAEQPRSVFPIDNSGDQSSPAEAPDTSLHNEIAGLAAFDDIQYERTRKAVADRLGFRASVLDRLVQAEREKLHGDKRQGQTLNLHEPEPWPDPVDGPQLLNDLAVAVRQHVVMSGQGAFIAALWIIHTYLSECFSISPRLAITSPEKGCGKTTTLDVLACLVFRPLPTANTTSAAIFRVVEMQRPSLLIDEADTFLRENEELRGILNSGHRKGGAVIRTVGEDFEPRLFSTYSPCAIALIGKLPATLHDRSVHIELRRRRDDEGVVQFRHGRTEHLATLARKAARWSADNAAGVQASDPQMPDGVINRVADNWRPLLAIADVAGGEWPTWTRHVLCMEQAAGAGADDSYRVLLLTDIRDTFAEQARDRLSSVELTTALVTKEGRRWAEWSSGRPINPNTLARLLQPFKISPSTIRTPSGTPKGYLLSQFDDAFARYLPRQGL